ncbi:PRD domain-containing protein [Clostridium senegalense]|uniref:PRD domain-containing protein n=1 Tax=Clostridium senegalense TaxID=1465809 RepID=A0A6M0H3F1_9CLOT|nr:PRD domain-containing protein [Clostridium senegalense]
MNRANVSRYLNELVEEGKLEKIHGRPVLFKFKDELKKTYNYNVESKNSSIDEIIGATGSLKLSLQQAKAAIIYPPNGLHTLILGETGVGKSYFAELMYTYGIESKRFNNKSPFITFNCADYADNPQLLISNVFGVKKGAYTGANNDRDGLLKKADGGIIFLDEVHRLPPQGQELLFTFMDKGYFRPLGETEKVIKASVQIIAATTEDPSSNLLKTFVRRIPMTITLPTLKNRGVNERYKLIELFIKEESKRINKNIYITHKALAAFLSYQCLSNIGQLKSDIQLACAKSFLNYKLNKKKYVLITQEDVSSEVKKELLDTNNYIKKVYDVLKIKGDVISFYYKENDEETIENYIKIEDDIDFYDGIERKFIELKNKGLDEDEINEIINIGIESHFKSYVGQVPKEAEKSSVKKIVGEEILNLVDYILNFAEKKLKRNYGENIYVAFALHINETIKRINKGKKIYNPKLDFIRANYNNEFLVAMEITKKIECNFKIQLPLDEIGYITLFLVKNYLYLEQAADEKVNIVLVLHGESTATSMANVVNELIGVNHIIPIDMPLNMEGERIYSIVKGIVEKIANDKGTLLLVDMGPLVNFADMIYEETGIIVKSIDGVTTSTVIETCRKAIFCESLDSIYKAIVNKTIYDNNMDTKMNLNKENIIITACFTGDGAAERLKRIIKDKIHIDKNVDIISMNIINRIEFLTAIDYYKENYNIIAIVGTIPIYIKDILFISAIEILQKEGIKKLETRLKEENIYNNISETLKEHLVVKDCHQLLNIVKSVIDKIKCDLSIEIMKEVELGIVLHICFLVDKLIKGYNETKFELIDEFKKQYSRELVLIEEAIKPLEEIYEIKIGMNELAYICKMFLCNSKESPFSLSTT